MPTAETRHSCITSFRTVLSPVTLTGSVLCSPTKVHTSVPLEKRTKFRGLGQV